MASRMIGAHMPTAGGLSTAIAGGAAIGCTAVQLFTANPKQWRHPPLADEEIAAFRAAVDETGIPFTCAHDSYLINLAAPDDRILQTSISAFRRELERADALRIPWVVTHMGAHLNTGEEAGLLRLSESIAHLLVETDQLSAGIALETTAGQGTGLGYRFEQIGDVMRNVGPHPRLGVCLDTCHVFVAGYDLTTEDGYRDMWARFDDAIGLQQLKIIHCNDAKKPLGSRVDRHEHIGQGAIGLEPFRRLVRDPALAAVPMIVETPEADAMHVENVRRLWEMAQEG